jgi:hypothetical protein
MAVEVINKPASKNAQNEVQINFIAEPPFERIRVGFSASNDPLAPVAEKPDLLIIQGDYTTPL